MQYHDINTLDFTDNNTLFFIRKKGKEHFFKNVYNYKVLEQLFPHFSDFKTISEYSNADYYINLNEIHISDLSFEEFEFYNSVIKSNLSSIIFRCRGLRGIPYDKAKELTIICTKFWLNFFKKNDFKLLVIHIIDNYVLDILNRIAKKKGIKIMVLSEFFIYGYRRHTLYGEINITQRQINSEIPNFIEYFEKKEKSFWLKGFNQLNNFKFFIYLYFSYYARFLIRYLYNYKILGKLNYEFRFANLIGELDLKNILSLRYFDKINKNDFDLDINNIAYLPLHIYPEANVDYWLNNENDADYYTTIYEALALLKEKKILVYVKEHPGFLFLRELNFYKNIKAYPNVRLINPFDPNCQILDKVENVLIWHGSAGIEGVMQNKNVYTYDYNFYSKGYIQSIKNFGNKKVLSKDEKRGFIENILKGVVKFKMND